MGRGEIRRIIGAAPSNGHEVIDGIGRALPADVADTAVRTHDLLAVLLVATGAPDHCHPWGPLRIGERSGAGHLAAPLTVGPVPDTCYYLPS
ncbi:hypothetical protein LBMAG15_17900 [Actinomycetes bacterium]|nr:hypothetical protein LBMAG15_17900 [Actinomycetes bacterium]